MNSLLATVNVVTFLPLASPRISGSRVRRPVRRTLFTVRSPSRSVGCADCDPAFRRGDAVTVAISPALRRIGRLPADHRRVAMAATTIGTGWMETYRPSQTIDIGAYRQGVKKRRSWAGVSLVSGGMS